MGDYAVCHNSRQVREEKVKDPVSDSGAFGNVVILRPTGGYTLISTEHFGYPAFRISVPTYSQYNDLSHAFKEAATCLGKHVERLSVVLCSGEVIVY